MESEPRHKNSPRGVAVLAIIKFLEVASDEFMQNAGSQGALPFEHVEPHNRDKTKPARDSIVTKSRSDGSIFLNAGIDDVNEIRRKGILYDSWLEGRPRNGETRMRVRQPGEVSRCNPASPDTHRIVAKAGGRRSVEEEGVSCIILRHALSMGRDSQISIRSDGHGPENEDVTSNRANRDGRTFLCKRDMSKVMASRSLRKRLSAIRQAEGGPR
ncbi:hypothetical protein KM043_005389 [Ampulex compressa]|nr:hypothetical protein KM043_005389 [Ampulex compressa]